MPERQRTPRHRPVPGLLLLPRHLLSTLAPRTRKIVIVACLAVAAGLVALIAVLAPRIAENKRQTAAQDRAAARALAADRRRFRIREQRPRAGSAPELGRKALRPAIERAIVTDLNRRRAGNPDLTRAVDGRCRTLAADRPDGRLLYSCTAVTSDIPRVRHSGRGYVGYPYRALGDPATGRFDICKVAGRAGEGSLYTRDTVTLPAACGG